MRVEDRDVDIEPEDTLPSVEITMRFRAEAPDPFQQGCR